MATKTTLPQDAAERKATPVVSGVLDYFPAALAEVARVSKAGNDQHNPGEPLHWARGKSSDHADALLRHLMERGAVDTDGLRHSAKAAWRALALLQEELEAAGAPLARGARDGRAHEPIAADSIEAALDVAYSNPGDPVSPLTQSEHVASGDTLWERRTNTRNQGECHVHAVGVCVLCDQTYPESSRLHSGNWYKLLPVHTATVD